MSGKGQNAAVIRNIEIKNLRGFRHFRLEGLTDLTILTGRNACGKSTVLDALLMGASPDFLEAVGETVQRHPRSRDGARWLFKDPREPLDLRLESFDEKVLIRRLRFSTGLTAEAKTAAEELSESPFRSINAYELSLHAPSREYSQQYQGFLVFDQGGHHERRPSTRPTSLIDSTRLIDPAVVQELAKSFSKVVQKGLRSRLQDFLRAVLPDLLTIQILSEDDDTPIVYLEWPGGAVPLSYSGDGIAAMLQIATEAFLVEPGGLVLIEEPEVFLHPKGISEVAGLLIELMRGGRQVVLTTHSLELIDSLLGRSQDEDIDRMSLFNLRPSEGATQIVAWPGKQLDIVRNQIGDDLR